MGSEMKQVKKCSRNTSLGNLPPKSCPVHLWCIAYVRSTRSRKYGIHPVPPSDSATRMGKFLITRDHNRSEAALQIFIGCSVIITSTGASGAVMASCPDEPRWIDSTTCSSHSDG